jgi:hypothetical protein
MEEVRALLAEIVDYTGICSAWDYPLPPAGLPGRLHTAYSRNDREADLLELGIRYVYAVVNNERRAMHNRWEDAGDFIRRIEQKVEERVREEYVQAEVRRCLEREEEMAAAKLVYFIGAASGPIKIGIAVRPLDRLRGLQTGHHEPLELLATCEGGETQERAYHKLFSGRRLKGEWFERCPEIEAEIERLR